MLWVQHTSPHLAIPRGAIEDHTLMGMEAITISTCISTCTIMEVYSKASISIVTLSYSLGYIRYPDPCVHFKFGGNNCIVKTVWF